MLRETVIVLSKVAALTSGLTVEAFADGGGRGQSSSALRMIERELLAPTSQAAALLYGRPFEVVQI
jgi:hypothetical protein